MERESFVWYASFSEAIKLLKNQKDQLNAFIAITDYWIYWREPDEEKIGKMPYVIFLLAKPQIDANNKRFVVSKKWWAPKWNQNARKNRNQLLIWENQLKQPLVELTKQ